jgi:hypothetical protein
MRKRIAVPVGAAVAVAAAVIVATTALAKPSTAPMKLSATLNIAQEVPKEHGAPSNAGGTFTATVVGTTLKWKLTFQNLTGAATAAHIHLGAKGHSGPVLIPLCGAGCRSPVSGATIVAASVAKTLESGGTYVNVHTKKNPNGEIRGQLKATM